MITLYILLKISKKTKQVERKKLYCITSIEQLHKVGYKLQKN